MPAPWRAICCSGVTVLVLAGCLSSPARRCGDTGDPSELRRLSITTDSTVVALRRATDSQVTPLRQYLQSVVDRAAQLDMCGRVTTARDLRAAAQLGVSASVLGLETAERAYRWSRRAVVADTADRVNWRVMAYAWDQLQVAQQRPQWFATVVACPAGAGRRCQLAPIDTTRVTDAERAELGLRTLAQQRELIDSVNRSRPRP
jgi:hypothetical protein